MKLNLGCYDKKLPGFINVDIREDVNPDVVDDAFLLTTFENNSVDLIYSCHMLEHLNYEQCVSALNRWFEILKSGGSLRISVPDFEALCRRYIYKMNIDEVLHSVCGSQKHEFDFHLNIFDEQRLTRLLSDVGFVEIKRYNWWEVDPHHYCDDFSRAYIPSNSPTISLSHSRLIKGDGISISLNMEAKK